MEELASVLAELGISGEEAAAAAQGACELGIQWFADVVPPCDASGLACHHA